MTFSVESVSTHAEPSEDGKLVQWAEVRVLIPKDFDWAKQGPKLLKKLQDATAIVGRGVSEKA